MRQKPGNCILHANRHSQPCTVFLLHCSYLLSLIHNYNTDILYLSYSSHAYLHSSLTIAPAFLRCSSYSCPLFVRYMFSICSVKHWTYTGQILDIYWTYTEHEWELLTGFILATLGFNTGSIGVLLEKNEVKLCRKSKGRRTEVHLPVFVVPS